MTDRWIWAVSAVMQTLYRPVVGKRELRHKAKLSFVQDSFTSRLFNSAGLGTPQYVPRRAGGGSWGEGGPGISAKTVALMSLPYVSGR